MTIEKRLELASQYLENQLIINAPKDTWNLALNSIRLVQIDSKYWKIVIGGEIAPYAIFTNEPWINRKGTNPNEHWIEDTISMCREFMQSIMSGAVGQDEIDKVAKGQSDALDTQYEYRLEEINKALGGA